MRKSLKALAIGAALVSAQAQAKIAFEDDNVVLLGTAFFLHDSGCSGMKPNLDKFFIEIERRIGNSIDALGSNEERMRRVRLYVQKTKADDRTAACRLILRLFGPEGTVFPGFVELVP